MADDDNAMAKLKASAPVDLNKQYPNGVAQKVACFLDAQNGGDIKELRQPAPSGGPLELYVVGRPEGPTNNQTEPLMAAILDTVNHAPARTMNPNSLTPNVVAVHVSGLHHDATAIISLPDGSMTISGTSPGHVEAITESPITGDTYQKVERSSSGALQWKEVRPEEISPNLIKIRDKAKECQIVG